MKAASGGLPARLFISLVGCRGGGGAGTTLAAVLTENYIRQYS